METYPMWLAEARPPQAAELSPARPKWSGKHSLLAALYRRLHHRDSPPQFRKLYSNAHSVWESYKAKELVNLVDPTLKMNFLEEEAGRFFKVDLFCAQETVKHRPRMSMVVKMLNNEMDMKMQTSAEDVVGEGEMETCAMRTGGDSFCLRSRGREWVKRKTNKVSVPGGAFTSTGKVKREETSLTQSNQVPPNPTPLQLIQSAIWVSSQNLHTAQSMVKSILDSSAGNVNRTSAAKNCMESLTSSEYRISRTTEDALPHGRIKDARIWMSASLLYQQDCWSALNCFEKKNPFFLCLNHSGIAVLGDGFMASGLTIQNTAGPDKHQAVAFRSDSDLSVIENCEFLGHQDTLYARSLRQFYKSCRIQGNVDFIFGNSASVFQDCQILICPRQVDPAKGEKNTITAHSRNDPAQSTGFVFRNCLINGTKEYMVLYHNNPKVHLNYLGRPWKLYSRTVFIHCNLEALITPEGW
ncbi:hypothetical protein F2P56_001405, partial [Juglans regia]